MEFGKNFEDAKKKYPADCDGKGTIDGKEVFVKMHMDEKLYKSYQENNKDLLEKVYNEKGNEMKKKVKLGDIKLD